MRTYTIKGKPIKTVTIEVDGHSLTLNEGIEVAVMVVVEDTREDFLLEHDKATKARIEELEGLLATPASTR